MADAPVPSGSPAPTLNKEEVAIREILKHVQVDEYGLGLHFNVIVDNKLAEGAGFKTSAQYFQKTFADVSRAQLYRYGSVARTFTPEVAARSGVSRLVLLDSYSVLAHLKLEADPDNLRIDVPDGGSGPTQPKPFADCTVSDLNAAIHHLKSPGGLAIPASEQELLGQFQAALAEEAGPSSHVTLRATAAKGGVTTVSLEHVPLGLLARVAAALAQVDPPPQATAAS